MDIPSPSHRQTWDLIPWIVNGSATAADRARVDAHLQACADCRDEYAFQSQLHAGMAVASASERDPRPGFQRLLDRIDGDRADDGVVPDAAMLPASRVIDRRQRHRTRHGSRWARYRTRVLVAAIIVQSVGLLLLGALLLGGVRSSGSNARYETLSRIAVPAAAATIRFVPEPTLTVDAMQAILANAKVRIVESNQGSSIYGLAPEAEADSTADAAAKRSAKTEAAIARLRAQPGVLLAEPIAPVASGLR